MKETPFYFTNEDTKIFGILHEPESEKKTQGFVFCHPLLEEKLWAHRVFVNFARELAARGYPVMRFDYRGHGDSGGNFEKTDINSRISDIRKSIEEFREKQPDIAHIGLIGLRFGATLASIVTEDENCINSLILWDPIISGESYMQELLRVNLTTQTAVYKEIRYNREKLVEQLHQGKTVNIDGYEINQKFYNQAIKINLLGIDKKYNNECLIVQISRKPERINRDYEKLRNIYQKAELKSVNEFAFWKEIKKFYYKADDLFKTTLEWLENE